MDGSPESMATGVSLLGGGSVSVAMVAAVFYERCATMATMADAYWSTLTLVLDLAGTFAFCLSGGLAAVRARLDLYGVLVLAGVVGLVGGIVRDVLLGALPPATFSDWSYLATVAASGLVAFFAGPTLERLYGPLNAFDAAGLSLFCMTGATKGLAFGVGPVQAVQIGRAHV